MTKSKKKKNAKKTVDVVIKKPIKKTPKKTVGLAVKRQVVKAVKVPAGLKKVFESPVFVETPKVFESPQTTATPKIAEASKIVSEVPKEEKLDRTMAIVGLILNLIILPGLGTLIGGGKSRTTIGVIQLVLTIISIPLMLVFVGFLLLFVVWVWALVTSIQMVQEADK